MKKIFRVLSVLIAAVMLAAVLPVMSVSAASFSEAKDSVVYIETDFTNSDGEIYDRYRGSGFAIGVPGEKVEHIVTNEHVLRNEDTGDRASEIRVYFSYASNDFMRAKIAVDDVARDIAVLELPEATDKREALVICRSRDRNEDDECASLGYPAFSERIVEETSTTYDLSDISIKRGAVQNQITDDNDIELYTLDKIELSPGESGGPLVNENNEVIGINSYTVFGLNDNVIPEEKHYAIVIDELVNIIRRDDIPYTLSTEVSSSVGESGEDTDAESESAPASKDNTMLIVIAIAAVVVIVAVVIVIVVLKSRKRSAPVSPVQPVSPVPQRSAVITGMKGIMANRSFEINGGIILGRNSQKCNVCFPVDSKGISGVHCQIRQSGGGYEIVDLGSSNGTFLGNGQKLTPNVPVFIPDGTYFYLGSAEQLFQIKY